MLMIAAFSFMLFKRIYLRSRPTPRIGIIILAITLTAPAFCIISNYRFNVPFAPWFTEFRAFPGSEMTVGLVGAILGVMFASDKLRPSKLNSPILIVCIIAAVLLASRPFLEHLLMPAPYKELKEQWKDGICLQSCGYTCVPACAVTLVKMMGGHVTEPELAIEAGTCATGTEFWYLKRALRKHGYEAHWRYYDNIQNAPAPSILGVKVGSIGHVVVLLRKDKEGLTIGDPLSGRKEYTWSIFKRVYQPDGGCYTIRRKEH
jgi:predicted double-glycine peptidase